MDKEIIIAIIGMIEAILLAVLPTIISKNAKKKSEALTREMILPHHVKNSGNLDVDAEIEQIYKQASETFGHSSYTSIYLSQYKASIDLYIDGTCVKVKSSYTLSFVNPYHDNYTFKRIPKLELGMQYDTYEWTEVTYQKKPCMEYIRNYPEYAQQATDGKSRIKSGLEIPLERELTTSVLHFSSQYSSECAKFFHIYKFWHHCKMLDVDIRLSGPDADKYRIEWAVFLSTNSKSTNFERNIHADQPNHVSFSDSGWIFPSDGYVVTINKVA